VFTTPVIKSYGKQEGATNATIGGATDSIKLQKESVLSTGIATGTRVSSPIVARCVHNTCDKVVREAGRGD